MNWGLTKQIKKKKKSELFPVSRACPHPAKPDEQLLDPRMYIRYRGGCETISLLKTFCVLLSFRSLTKVQTFAIVNIYVHRYVKKLNLKFKETRSVTMNFFEKNIFFLNHL